MRYIDLHGSGGPTDPAGALDTAWIAEAEAVTRLLIAASDKATRDALIKANEKLWGRLREWLLSLSYNKCWYSEARDLFSVPEVEHYRPKTRCKRRPRGSVSDGYWWLAFNWSNYRICGKVGNSKKLAFPFGRWVSGSCPQWFIYSERSSIVCVQGAGRPVAGLHP